MANLVTRNPRAAVLCGLLIGLVLSLVMQQRLLETSSVSELGKTVMYEAHELPVLRWPRTNPTVRGNATNVRNPFSFPPRWQKEVQTPPIDEPTSPTEKPKQNKPHTVSPDRRLAITYEYLGYIGPFRRPFAVFRHNGEIELAKTGQALDGGVVLREFNHLEAVFTSIEGENPREINIPVADR